MNFIVGLLLLLQSNVRVLHDTTGMGHSNKEEIKIYAPKVFIAGKQNEIAVVLKTNSNAEWTGYISFEITDNINKQNVDGLFSNVFPNQYFTVSKKDSSILQFPITIPVQLSHPVSLSVKVFEGEKLLDSLAVIVPCKK